MPCGNHILTEPPTKNDQTIVFSFEHETCSGFIPFIHARWQPSWPRSHSTVSQQLSLTLLILYVYALHVPQATPQKSDPCLHTHDVAPRPTGAHEQGHRLCAMSWSAFMMVAYRKMASHICCLYICISPSHKELLRMSSFICANLWFTVLLGIGHAPAAS